MIDLFRGGFTSAGAVSASSGSASVVVAGTGWKAGNIFEIVFDEVRGEAEILPVVQACQASSDTVQIRTLAPQTFQYDDGGTNKIGLRCRFEDVATGNLVKPSRASLLVQVPS